jgi:hypothetical protein
MRFLRSSSGHLSSKSKSTEVDLGKGKADQGSFSSRIPSAPQPENNQLQSKIFSLPLELRILIYRYTIQDFGWASSIHIVTRSQLTRASPTPWTSTEGDLPDGNKLTLVPCAAHMGDPFQISGSHYGHWPRGHLACERVASWKTVMPIDGPTRPKDFTSLSPSPMGLLLSCQRMCVTPTYNYHNANGFLGITKFRIISTPHSASTPLVSLPQTDFFL